MTKGYDKCCFQDNNCNFKNKENTFKAAKLLDFDSTSNASSEMTGNSEEYQVYGPTTRRKWSQWIARPMLSSSSHSSLIDTDNVSEASRSCCVVVTSLCNHLCNTVPPHIDFSQVLMSVCANEGIDL